MAAKRSSSKKATGKPTAKGSSKGAPNSKKTGAKKTGAKKVGSKKTGGKKTGGKKTGGRAGAQRAPARPAKVRNKVAKKRATARGGAARTAGAAEIAAPAVDPQVERIQHVIDVMVAAGAVEVELDGPAGKLRVRLKEDQPRLSFPAPTSLPAPTADYAAPSPIVTEIPGAEAQPGVTPGHEVFRSPMVGTFYRASSPDSEPFVKAGDHIGGDSVLCIIEAMKVMNEIKAEMEGEVVEVLAQNGEPVDYGQPLFVIKV